MDNKKLLRLLKHIVNNYDVQATWNREEAQKLLNELEEDTNKRK